MTEEDPIEGFSSPDGRSTQAPSRSPSRRSPRPLTAQSTAQSTIRNCGWSYSRLPQLPKGDWDEPKNVASGRAWEPRPVIFVLRNYGLGSATQSEEGTYALFREFRTVADAARAANASSGSMISKRAGMSRGEQDQESSPLVVHISNEYPSEPVYVFDNYVQCRAIVTSLEKDGARKVKPRASGTRPAKLQRTSSIGKP